MANFGANIDLARQHATALWEAIRACVDDRKVYDALLGQSVGAYDDAAFTGRDITATQFNALMVRIAELETWLTNRTGDIVRVKA